MPAGAGKLGRNRALEPGQVDGQDAPAGHDPALAEQGLLHRRHIGVGADELGEGGHGGRVEVRRQLHFDRRRSRQDLAGQGLLHPGERGERQNQCRDSETDSGGGHEGEKAHEGVLAGAAQITQGERQGKRQIGGAHSGRRSGKRMTSRIDARSAKIIVRRSMPMPSPPAGGMACSSART